MQSQYSKNALSLIWGAFFFASALLSTNQALAVDSASCTLQSSALNELLTARVARVTDGDTVAFESGEKVRLLGINTPELGNPKSRYTAVDEPLAQQAKQVLEQLLAASDYTVYYRTGAQPRDRYKRLLADLYTGDGKSVAAELLERGLAWQVTFIPNDHLAECLADAEQTARSGRIGLWAGGLYPPLAVDQISEGGFARLVGRVTEVRVKSDSDGQVSSAATLTIDGTLAVKLAKTVAQRYTAEQLQALQGRRIELRGWVSSRSGDWQLKLTSPYNLTAVD